MPGWAETALEQMIAKYKKSIPIAAKNHMIPYQGGQGRWIGSPYDGNSWWTGGFWPGLMWQFYAATGDDVFKKEALRVDALLARELSSFSKLNHDVGFMYLLSAGAEYRFIGAESAAMNALHAATILAGRMNPNGFIRAWNDDKAGWAIIDCMMNLCLLYWASAYTGDPRFTMAARLHADTALREFVREDGSCWHIVVFDPENGKAIAKPAGQGYAAGSSWSRGQAWGLYGFTLAYLALGESRYLDAACAIADYFIANIREDGLTDCDFCQPKDVVKIDNIAAACAACGLLELERTGMVAHAEAYHTAAEKMLRALTQTCADWTNESVGILQKCTAAYHDDGAGTHVNLVYGDYFLAEALAKMCGIDPMLWLVERG